MVTAPALRGATDRAKRHIQQLLIHPSQQSARLEAVLRAAMGGDSKALGIVSGLGVNLSKVRHVLRLSVTLTHLNILTSLEQEFKRLGWIEQEHQLAVSVNLADLKCVLDLLQPVPHLFSYLAERSRLQRVFSMEGDELDWLGLYLATGFNMGKAEGEMAGFAITGMSSKIDEYYTARDAGLSSPKPVPRLTKLWQEMLAYPVERRFEGWLECGVALLQSASYDEQRKIEREFARICQKVPRVWRQEDHVNSVVITPPENRTTAIVVHAYPPQLAGKRRDTAQAVASHGFEKPYIERCIVFGRQVPQLRIPFSFVYVLGRGDDGQGGETA